MSDEARLRAVGGVRAEEHAAPEDRLWTVQEAARFLGVSRSWLYAHLHLVPHVRLPGSSKLRFVAADLRAWVKSHAKAGH